MNEIPVIILEGNTRDGFFTDEKNLVFFFSEKAEIQKAFLYVEAGNHLQSLTIICEDAKAVKKYLFSAYKKIAAAGGCIFNDKKEMLMILRHGMWDLPKGKIEKGEKNKKAAKREVMEEVGVQEVQVLKKIMKTYHTYVAAENQKVLKTTHWFLMHCSEEQLTPQTEEGIESAAWLNSELLQEKLKNTYGNIKLVADAALLTMHLL